MTRNRLTDRYLAEVRLEPDELTRFVRQRRDLIHTIYRGRHLTRPAFLTRAERERLTEDLTNLHSALAALPERRFGGDVAAFARALGMTEQQAAMAARGAGRPVSRLTRADIYHDGSDFRLMELNLGSPVGGQDNAILNELFLEHPAVAEFVKANSLSYVDTMAAGVATFRAECGLEPDQPVFMAAVDEPSSYAQIDWMLHAAAAELARYGIEAVACHLGQLRVHGGRVWYEDRPVDLLYRIFLLADVADPACAALIDPLLRAAERGEVALFSPIDTDLYMNKATLAMLSDEAYRDQLTPAERTSLDRLLPWTRMVRDEPVTVGGERVGLLDYALDQRRQLVLKPASLASGMGVVLGWEVDDAQWRARLTEALDGPYVLQQRLVGEPEPFPATDRPGTVPWLLRWGVYTAHDGYAGSIVVGSTDLSGGVLNIGGGATGGCVFHE
ncbi:MAG TPA: hypothetical protein VIL37_05150 [Natronosporangium sp.]